MNSHRDNVKDAIAGLLNDWLKGSKDINEFGADIADAVFDALGITEDEQDMAGGYWLLHAGVKPEPEVDLSNLVPDMMGEFNTLVKTSVSRSKLDDYAPHHMSNREIELSEGAKYTAGEFKGFCKAEYSDKNTKRLRLKTPICTYSQNYASDVLEDDARTNFVTYYYPMYLEDYERAEELKKEANGVEEWAETGRAGEGADVAKD
jgi:hypothetical protein